VDTASLARWVEEHGARLVGAVVQRVVCVGDGIILDLRQGHAPVEVGLHAAHGAAWATYLQDKPRDILLRDLATLRPEFAATAPRELALRSADATCLDALRAWLVRPATATPTWQQLQAATLRKLRTIPGDRRLWLEFERADAATTSRFELVAELFDRAGNIILNCDGDEIANWSGRKPAPALAREGLPQSSASPPGDHGSSRHGSAVQHSLAVEAIIALAAAAAASLARAHRQALQRDLKRLRTRMERLREDVAATAQAEIWRHHAELLSANLHRARRGQESIELEDLYAPGTTVTIALDPKLAPHENVAQLFKRVRRLARGKSSIEARMQETDAALRDLEARAGSIEHQPVEWSQVLTWAASTWKGAMSPSVLRADARILWAPGGPTWQLATADAKPQSRSQRGPGRSYLLPGNWEVRVGRNNADNDELTHRFAHADDVWLHASGVSGSHVVLRMHGRKDNPPREILEAAAAIAARFSRAKHARTVPVLWTRKRYVRKPRGSAPGLATCTNEKTLFVRPGLPDSGDDDESN
jgi:hypothetical protein